MGLIKSVVTIFALLLLFLVSWSALSSRGLPLISDVLGQADNKTQSLDEKLSDEEEKGKDSKKGSDDSDKDQGPAYEEDWEITLFPPPTQGGVVDETGSLQMQFEITNKGDTEGAYNIYIQGESGRKNIVDSLKVGPGESETTSVLSKAISSFKNRDRWCDMGFSLDQDNGPAYQTKSIRATEEFDSIVPSCESPEDLVYFSDNEDCSEEGFEGGINLFDISSTEAAVTGIGTSEWGFDAEDNPVIQYERLYLCMSSVLQEEAGNRIYTEISKAGGADNALITADNPCENDNELIRFANWDWDGNTAWFVRSRDTQFADTDEIVHLCYRNRGFKYDLSKIIQFHERERGEQGSCETGQRVNNGWFRLHSGESVSELSDRHYFAYITSGPDKGEKLSSDQDFANLCLHSGTYSTLGN